MVMPILVVNSRSNITQIKFVINPRIEQPIKVIRKKAKILSIVAVGPAKGIFHAKK